MCVIPTLRSCAHGTPTARDGVRKRSWSPATTIERGVRRFQPPDSRQGHPRPPEGNALDHQPSLPEGCDEHEKGATNQEDVISQEGQPRTAPQPMLPWRFQRLSVEDCGPPTEGASGQTRRG